MLYRRQVKYIGISVATALTISYFLNDLFGFSASRRDSINHSRINQSIDIKAEISKSSTFRQDPKLQVVVNNIVEYIGSKKLPIDALSVSLIDTKTGNIGRYNSAVPRYPASIVKIFWLVSAYQKFAKQEIQESSISNVISEMILKSDNQAANQVLEAITQTKSTIETLSENNLKKWQQSRQNINAYYQKSGYSKNIDISQKTFPIVQRNNAMPIGADLQVREDKFGNQVRNKLTTDDAAKLMYEIVVGDLLDSQSTIKVKKLLQRDLKSIHYSKQNPDTFNPIEGFFGQGLSELETNGIISKAGRTSSSRQEVAFITSKDGKVSYILTIFGDDPNYGRNKNLFPVVSKLVYKQMKQISQ